MQLSCLYVALLLMHKIKNNVYYAHYCLALITEIKGCCGEFIKIWETSMLDIIYYLHNLNRKEIAFRIDSDDYKTPATVGVKL